MIPVQYNKSLTYNFRNTIWIIVFVLAFNLDKPCFAAQTSEQAADIIATKCVSCHNDKALAGGFELVSPTGAKEYINPGNANKSRLVRAVELGKMPPTGKLTSAEMGILRKWVAEGAKLPKSNIASNPLALRPLWSFKPVQHPSVPKTIFDRLAVNPIDRFIFQKLVEKGLSPSPPANKLALLRRVTIDLTGLPPTSQEISTFLTDRSPGAYGKVVDRLLASSEYGERWGRHWLDVVRFGESNGYEQNHLRAHAWPYRDYVIRALNEDKQYNRFVSEQLAGDVLGKGDANLEAATGFLVAGIHDTVGSPEEELSRQQRSNDLDDMVSTTGATFLGLTVGCAKCHDHKFDPILQRDFYRLAACFAGVRHGDRPLSSRKLSTQEEQETIRLKSELNDVTVRLDAIDYNARLKILGSSKNSSTRPPVDARQNVDEFTLVRAKFVRFNILATTDGSEPCLDELQIFGSVKAINLGLASLGSKATASSLLPGFSVHQINHLNDGRLGNEWSWISAEPGRGWAQIELISPAEINRVVWSRDGGDMHRFDDRLPMKYHIDVSVDGVRWITMSTEAGRMIQPRAVPDNEIIASLSPEVKKERSDLISNRESISDRLSIISGQLMAYAGTFTSPDDTYMLRRGSVMQRMEKVTPGALSQLVALKSDLTPDSTLPESQRRLALAEWITNPSNPLTARVLVNRLWQHHFGRGIVGSPSDFGRNGEIPTHPELLDYLASDFMTLGWKMKRLHRMMVTSYTYMQSSAPTSKGVALDAADLMLWRMPLRRMEAEAVRDAILMTSGKLDRRMGGTGFNLYQYRVVNVAIYAPLDSYAPSTWRRSVYQMAARGIRDDLLSSFDCPESAQRAPKRDSTTTPLQALSLLNGPFIVQQSAFYAERIQKESSHNPASEVKQAFLLAFGRAPDKDELAGAIDLVQKHSLSDLCRALINSNEFLYY